MSMREDKGSLEPWPFEDAPDTAAITTSHVIIDLKPVVHIARDLEGNWQFLSQEGADESKIKLVALKTILCAHPDVREIADLALGWEAWRTSKNSPWNKRRDPDNNANNS
jgi:hypothetical protein